MERGRTSAQVLEQLHRHTFPMFERFVAPQEKWADTIVDAPIPEEAIQDLMNRIDQNLSPHSVGI
jgi:uridine kinase